MLNKSRHHGVASQRQHDIPGGSLRGPYKRWIPQSDSRLSESETDASKPSLHRPRGHPGSSSHVAVTDTSYAIPSPHSRHPNGSSSQNHVPMSHSHRSERGPHGYSSESTIHASPLPAKSSSGFSIFKPHVKDPRSHPSSSSRREEVPRSTIARASVPSRSPTQPLPIAQARSRDDPAGASDGVFGSLSTQTSTDPSPRSSTDSGPRSGHASAPAVQTSELHKHGHAIWHPSPDAKYHGSSSARHPQAAKRDDNKIEDKEDTVARVTEALGGGSTGKAKLVEDVILQRHFHPVKGDDVSSTRRTMSATASRVAETQSRTQPQIPQMLRRQKVTPQATPLHSNSHLPDTASKSSRPSTNSSRANPEAHARVQSPPEPPGKPAPPMSKLPTGSTSPTTKLPHSRTASSPWPFNQALPSDSPAPKPQSPQSYSTSWRSLSRFNGSLATTKPADVRLPPKDGSSDQISYVTVPESSQSSQAAHAPPPPSKSLPRSTASHAVHPSNYQHHARSRYEGSPSYVTQSTEQSSQRWIPPNAQQLSKPGPSTSVTVQVSNLSSSNQSLKAPDHNVLETASATSSEDRYTNHTQVFVASNVQTQPAPGTPGASQLEATSQPTWPISTRHARGDGIDTTPATDLASGRWTVDPTKSPSTMTHNQIVPVRSTPTAISTQHSQNASQSSRSATSRHADSIATASMGMDSIIGRSTTGTSQPSHSLPAGTWTSAANVSSSTGETANATRGLANGTVAQASQSASRSYPPTPPEQDTVGRLGMNGSATTTADRHVPGAWASKYLNANLSTTTIENLSTPKPPPKQSIFDTTTTTPSRYTPASSDSAGKGLRSQGTNTVSAVASTASTPGAWTTSSRYTTNTTFSIFDGPNNNKYQNLNSGREMSATMRQATLAATPVPGAWTTKTTTATISTTSDPAPKQTLPRNPSPPPPSLLKLSPPSGTGTGSSTPSSMQTSDINLTPVQLHSISTRVPISGHPSTPAPVRPILRPTPPPLSISSTLPDTDSLLTPSSLNSPKSTVMLPPQSQPVATITALPAPTDRDKGQRKGFFNFLRSKPPVYEVWMPPGHPKDKERKREESPKDPASSPPKSKPSTSVPVPRPKSPKIFSPFKLFSKRHRTVSSASLDVLDGNATNTLMNSPASSMRADTPGAPPSPPLRDAILATQEWRNKEATDLIVSGRKRRPRPGVTFDCPEDIAPADIVPSRLRVARLLEDDDDD